jgi:hypothetical protein
MFLSGCPGVVHEGVCIRCNAGNASDNVPTHPCGLDGANDGDDDDDNDDYDGDGDDGTYEFRRNIFSPLPP